MRILEKLCPHCGSFVELSYRGIGNRLAQLRCIDPNSSCLGTGLYTCFMVENETTALEAWYRRA